MAKYGNILIVKECTEEKKQKINIAISQNDGRYKDVENVYFIETNSVRSTRELSKAFKAIDMSFVFYRNKISDGSIVSSKGFATSTINNIKDLLL